MEIIAGIIGAAMAGLVALIGALFKRNQNKKDQYEHIENLVKLTSQLQDTNKILQDFTSLSRDFDYVRKTMDNMGNEIVKLSENTKNNDIMMLRHSILLIYFTYNEKKEIPEAQYSSVLGLYDVYHSLGGNSFITDIINEMKEWRRI